jgi:hypothetical protein
MSKIVVVEKTGILKETTIKNFSLRELYKKAGFKSPDNFKKIHTWEIEKNTITLFAKNTGRAGQENKYDFPPPVDNMLFFGACILVLNLDEDAEIIYDLSVPKWEKMYEFLFGGFEDLDDNEEESEDEDVDSDASFTKDGYMKDGFIVDEDEDEDDDYEEKKPKAKKSKKTKSETKSETETKTEKKKSTLFDKIETIPLEDMNEKDISDELMEEEYLE